MSFAFEKPDDDVMLKQPRRAVVPKDVLLEPSEVADMERATHIEVRTLLSDSPLAVTRHILQRCCLKHSQRVAACCVIEC
jgi:hypothetical protein